MEVGLLVGVLDRVAELELDEVGEGGGVLEPLAVCEATEVMLAVGLEEAGTLFEGDVAGELAGVLVAVEVVKEPLLGMH